MTLPITIARGRSIEGQATLTWYKSTPRFQADSRANQGDAPWQITILRRTETDFVRGDVYDEYFMGRDSTGASIIHQGVFTPSNQRKFTWVDTTAKYRQTYSYYIQVDDHAPVGPIPLRHTDPQVYWSHQRLVAELGQLEADFASVTVSVCGQTGSGCPVPLLRIGSAGPRLALVGLIHPGESGPELIVPALRMLLSDQPQLFRKVQVLAIPSVNIDGRQLQAEGTPWYIRKTPGGVDLNRNFPADWEAVAYGYGLDSSDPDAMTYRGCTPASTSEVQAVVHALTQSPPDVLLSYHALASLCSLPALYPKAAANDAAYVKHCHACIRAFAGSAFPDLPYDQTWARPGNTEGSLPLWVYRQFGAAAFDLEMGGPDPQAVQLARTDQTDPALLARYQHHHAQGIAGLLRWMCQSAA